MDGVPKIPASLAETAGRYGSYRSAILADWSPARREMLMATRFGDAPQLHLVKMPGGERQQLTFFPDSVTHRAISSQWRRLHFVHEGYWRWRVVSAVPLRRGKTGDVTLLTDGKSRNMLGPWSSGGDQIAYMSTRRTGQDTDLWVMNPADPKSGPSVDATCRRRMGAAGLVSRRQTDFAAEEVSINESYLWLVDADDGREDGADSAAMRKKKCFTAQRDSAKTARGFT